MPTSTTDLPAPLATHAHLVTSTDRRAAIRYGQALAYVWGAQDYAPEGEHDTYASGTFANAYVLSAHLSDGHPPMNLQDAYATWTATGRLVVRADPTAEHGPQLVSIHAETVNGATNVVARPIPHASDVYRDDLYRVRYSRPVRQH